MKAVNLFELTRVEDDDFAKFEAHLSQRDSLLKEKKCEINSLKSFVSIIEKKLDYEMFNGFYFSYTIPQISCEFDLLRIGHDFIINIELKSCIKNNNQILYQLQKHNFYLQHIGKDVFLYVYNSDDDKLFQLLDNQLQEIEFYVLIDTIKKQIGLFNGDINVLFQPNMFFVSPLNNTDKFLQRKYFLTSQQDEIKAKIDKKIKSKNKSYISIKGNAGCGKTLLVYDIALDYTNSDNNVRIIHCAQLCDGHIELNKVKGLDIYPRKEYKNIKYTQYNIIIIDEAQRIRKDQYDYILEEIGSYNINLIFSYDEKQMINRDEISTNMPHIIELLSDIEIHKLTNTIRINQELFSFIDRIVNSVSNKNNINYNNIELKYAQTLDDALKIINAYKLNGYKFIAYTPSLFIQSIFNKYYSVADQTSHSVIGQEFDNVILYLDDYFHYNNQLGAKDHIYHNYLLTNMFYQGATRTRNKLVLIVVDNKDLFEKILSILK